MRRTRGTRATATSQYATRHNPFVYFASITGHPSYCKAHVKALAALSTDLQKVSTTRALTYITPDLCHDAHDATCADGGPGGLRAANAFLKTWVPQDPLLAGLPSGRRPGDHRRRVGRGPRGLARLLRRGRRPQRRPAGHRRPWRRPARRARDLSLLDAGDTSTHAYNHYSLLRTMEDLFGLPRLGYARTVDTFGADVFNAG